MNYYLESTFFLLTCYDIPRYYYDYSMCNNGIPTSYTLKLLNVDDHNFLCVMSLVTFFSFIILSYGTYIGIRITD